MSIHFLEEISNFIINQYSSLNCEQCIQNNISNKSTKKYATNTSRYSLLQESFSNFKQDFLEVEIKGSQTILKIKYKEKVINVYSCISEKKFNSLFSKKNIKKPNRQTPSLFQNFEKIESGVIFIDFALVDLGNTNIPECWFIGIDSENQITFDWKYKHTGDALLSVISEIPSPSLIPVPIVDVFDEEIDDSNPSIK